MHANFKIIKPGDTYGLTGSLTATDWYIEVYDGAYANHNGSHGFTELGQFVSRYYAKTFTGIKANTGLDLNGQVPNWKLNADQVNIGIGMLTDAGYSLSHSDKPVNPRQALAAELTTLLGQETMDKGPQAVASALDEMNKNLGFKITYRLRNVKPRGGVIGIDVDYYSLPEHFRTDMINLGITPDHLI